MPPARQLLLASLLLFCGAFRATAQLPADSLLKALTGRQAPMEKLSTLRELSRATDLPEERLLHFAQRTTAYADTVLALPGIDRKRALSLKASGVYNTAYSTYRLTKPASREAQLAGYRQAEELWRASGDRERIAFVLNGTAYALDAMGRGKDAQPYDQEALSLYTELKDTVGMIGVLERLSERHQRNGDLPGALRLAHRAIGMAANAPSYFLSGLERLIGKAYAAAQERDSAIQYFRRAMDRVQPAASPRDWYSAAREYMHQLILAGRQGDAIQFWETLTPSVKEDTTQTRVFLLRLEYASALLKAGRLREAVQEGETSKALLEACGCYGSYEVTSSLFLGDAYLEDGRPQKALLLARGAWDKAVRERYSIELQRDAAYLLERVYAELGRPAEALRFNREVKLLEDSMDVLELRRELTSMEWRKQQAADSLRVAEEKRQLQEEAEARVAAQRNRKLQAFGGGAGVLVLAFVLWRRLGRTRQEKARSEAILHNVLPEEVARELRETGTAQNRAFEQVTILFTDFQDFTELSATLTQQQLMNEIEACFTAFDGICQRHGVEKIKTIGDAYMAAAGLKGDAQQAAVSTVTAALEMQAFIEARHTERSAQGLHAFRMRVGIHTGPVVAGIVGVKKFQYDIWGDTVNTASRMESSGEVGRVNISEATYALVKEQAGASTPLSGTSLFTFTPRGKVQAKGKGEMEMYFVHRPA